MGISWSKRQQNHHHHHHHPHPHPHPRPPPPTPLPPSSSIPPPFPSFSPPPPPPPPHPPYSFPLLPPPHNAGPSNYYPYHANYSQTSNYGSTRLPPPPPVVYQNYNYPPYYRPHSNNGWGLGFRPPLPEVPYVDHQNAKQIKNDVNVHKDTIRLQVDEFNKDFHLVSFTFDALVHGRYLIMFLLALYSYTSALI
ncbi:probable E3 ubiquitin-protein ligase LUL3 [Lycium ferocissimum]|uniref:probable E3 ubiquitin-protein ligase LUL3 n=1 Tax=Lycium ferocissimum TaxID=112874 RepID=UPI002815F8A2|nr:probable E3 ubiquitin-protein ligase LUL3 [Lycium ferocissimum]